MTAGTPVAPLAPIAEKSRIEALDAVRGFALLGIFLVNIQSFAEPLGLFIDHAPPEGSSTFDAALYYAVKAVAEGKFYPLFSILFGIGLVVQFRRASDAKRSFVPLYLRRLLVLALFGLAHALLLWYGDILFLYAIVGVPLLLMRKLRPKTMLLVSITLISVSTVLWTGFAALGVVAERAATTATAPAESSAPPAAAPHEASPDAPQSESNVSQPADEAPVAPPTALRLLADGLETGESFDPTSDVRLNADTIAFRDGPYLHAVIMRAVDWATFMMVAVIAMGWHVAAMFLLGAALMKWNVFDPSRRTLQRRLALLGLPLGLTLAAAISIAPAALGDPGVIVQAFLTFSVGPLVALGYLAAITLLVHSGRARPLVRALANAGRMALSVYLLESIVSSAIFQHWGLALFNETTRPARIVLVFGVYASLVAFATLWLRTFAIGPFEWVWRSLTYLRPQPLLRRDRPPTSPA